MQRTCFILFINLFVGSGTFSMREPSDWLLFVYEIFLTFYCHLFYIQAFYACFILIFSLHSLIFWTKPVPWITRQNFLSRTHYVLQGKDAIFVIGGIDYKNTTFALKMFLAGILPILWFILLYLCTTM